MASAMKIIFAGLILSGCLLAAEFPHTEITNGLVKAQIYLPDKQRGYYRGVRFDWSGVVPSLTYQGHEFFGQWFPTYDPLLHDAIMGPVEEFRNDEGALGFADAKVNGMFVKIGVGVLRKPDDKPYDFTRQYQLVNPGKRIVRANRDHVEFVHELNDGEGFAYVYQKTLRLPKGKAQLVLEHSLKNTGKRAIDTGVYDHDFYMLDHQSTGPDFRLKFAFAPKAKDTLKAPARIEGNEIRFDRELSAPPESASGYLTGFGESAADNDVRLEDVKAGIGVRETGDHPVSSLYLWSIKTTICPEFYIHIHVEPGQTFKWRTTYEFYSLK